MRESRLLEVPLIYKISPYPGSDSYFCGMSMSPRKISIFPLLAVSFVSALGYGIVLPSLVYIVERFHGGNFLYGAIGASYSAFQFIGAPILGKLSDRFGRKRILFICMLGSTVAWALFIVAFRLPLITIGSVTTSITGGIALTLPMLVIFIARSVDGLTAGDLSVANAYVADIATEQERKADFGKMGVAGNLGFILGPALAGVLAQTSFGILLPIETALATSIFALLLIVFFLRESHPRNTPSLRRRGKGGGGPFAQYNNTFAILDHPPTPSFFRRGRCEADVSRRANDGAYSTASRNLFCVLSCLQSFRGRHAALCDGIAALVRCRNRDFLFDSLHRHRNHGRPGCSPGSTSARARRRSQYGEPSLSR